MKRLLWFSLLFVMICCAERAKAQNPATLNIPNSRIQGGVNGNCLYDNAGKLGSKTCGGGGGSPAGPILSVQSNKNNSALDGNATFVANYTALAVPSAPIITHAGTAGMATWGYEIVAGLIGASPVALGSTPSTAGTTTTGNATLDMTNFNIVTPPACVSGETSFDVYRTTSGGTPSTTGLIGNVACGGNLHDTGLVFIQPNTGVPGGDGSVGVASSIPYINDSAQIAFGNLASGNLSSGYFFQNVGIVGVYESTADPNYANASIVQAVELQHSAGGNTVLEGFAVDLVVKADATRAWSIKSDLYQDANTTISDSPIIYGANYTPNAGSVVSPGNIVYMYQATLNDMPIADDIRAFSTINAASQDNVVGKFSTFYAVSPTVSGGGSITNLYGIFLEDQTVGTNSWAIKTGLGLVQWGDREQEATVVFASLPSVTQQMEYCSDCTVTSGVNNTCVGSGTGAHFEVINGVKKCWQ